MSQTRVLGILAHVDAGKTTLSEQILFQSHTIRQAGRVDHQDSFLDNNPLEKRRGITIFSGQAPFVWKESPWYLVDTPGHADFTAEMERCLGVLDAAVLVVSCVEGVQGHTETIWQLLRKNQIPTFFFLNKTDRAGADPERVMRQIEKRFQTTVCLSQGEITSAMMELAAERDDALLERYFAGAVDESEWNTLLPPLMKEGVFCPAVAGAALSGTGVEPLLTLVHQLTPEPGGLDAPFSARIYQIRRDTQGNRVAFLRVTGGQLKTKDWVGEDKINELRRYSGNRFQTIQQVQAGDLCGATGLSSASAGESIGEVIHAPGKRMEPMLSAAVHFDEKKCPNKTMLSYFRILEDEEPALGVQWVEALQEIQVRVMGVIQLEVLQEMVRERFSQEVTFWECRVLYRETISNTVIGRGHFEPLRHYAEVKLRLEPGEPGSGVVFASECHTDELALNWQRLIETHVYEKEHKGVLTGSPITDLTITLLAGRAHEKHTEGGDFREATYRAIRQGLMKADSVLLEPWYAFTAVVPTELTGRLLSDIQQMGGEFEIPETLSETSVISGRAPVEKMAGYQRELISYTRGTGSLSLRFSGYEPCGQAEKVLASIGYEAERDTENPAGSVFCSHGAGFFVPWQEADGYMHLE